MCCADQGWIPGWNLQTGCSQWSHLPKFCFPTSICHHLQSCSEDNNMIPLLSVSLYSRCSQVMQWLKFVFKGTSSEIYLIFSFSNCRKYQETFSSSFLEAVHQPVCLNICLYVFCWYVSRWSVCLFAGVSVGGRSV